MNTGNKHHVVLKTQYMFQTDKQLCWWECNLVTLLLLLFFVYVIKHDQKSKNMPLALMLLLLLLKCNSYCMRWIRKHVRFTVSLKDDSRIIQIKSKLFPARNHMPQIWNIESIQKIMLWKNRFWWDSKMPKKSR